MQKSWTLGFYKSFLSLEQPRNLIVTKFNVASVQDYISNPRFSINLLHTTCMFIKFVTSCNWVETAGQ